MVAERRRKIDPETRAALLRASPLTSPHLGVPKVPEAHIECNAERVARLRFTKPTCFCGKKAVAWRDAERGEEPMCAAHCVALFEMGGLK